MEQQRKEKEVRVRFLPKEKLSQNMFQWLQGKWEVQARDGVDYRMSKEMDDRSHEVARYGELVHGIDEGDGWVKCTGGFIIKADPSLAVNEFEATLMKLSFREMKQQAKDLGMERLIDEADEADNPRVALLELIMKNYKPAFDEAAEREKRRSMERRDLAKEAKDLGISQDDRDTCHDAGGVEDIKSALIDLIIPKLKEKQ